MIVLRQVSLFSNNENDHNSYHHQINGKSEDLWQTHKKPLTIFNNYKYISYISLHKVNLEINDKNTQFVFQIIIDASTRSTKNVCPVPSLNFNATSYTWLYSSAVYITKEVDLHLHHIPISESSLKHGHCLYKEPWSGRAVSHFTRDLEVSTSVQASHHVTTESCHNPRLFSGKEEKKKTRNMLGSVAVTAAKWVRVI